MIDKKRAIKYCKNDISLIENYDQAIADMTQTWDCHHRRETIYSRSGLIEIGEYYNRPACELIFLTHSEHLRLHHLGKHPSEESRKKMSEAKKGKPSWIKGKHHSEDTRKKMSEATKGKHHSEETRKKISDALNGENHPMFGKHHTAEARKKISEVHKGTIWYNNGVKSIRAKTCPEGFVPGRLKCI